MGVASPSIVNPSRNKALMVRLAPFLVETVCELTRAVRDKTHAQTEISGLLFGRSEDGLVTVEAIKTFKDSGPRSDLARRERMEKAFEAAMALAHDDPEFTPYRLLGWFSLRGGGGLISSDVEFHNRHFKDSDEVALIVWRESDTQITAELYARIEEGKLTSEDYRWSSVRLSSELRSVSQPIDLAMRLRINDDLYLRTYAVPDARDRKDEWRKVAKGALNSVLSLIPRRSQTPDYALEDLAPPPLEFAPAIEGSKVPLTPIPLRPLPKRELKRQPAFESKPEPEAKSELKIEPTPEPIAEPQLESQLETELEREPEPKLEVAPEPTPEPKPEPVEAKMPPLEAPLPQHEPESNPIAEEEKPVPAAARRPRHADTRILPIEPTPAAADYEPTRSARPRSAPELSGLPMVIQPRRLHHKGMPWLSMALVAVLFSGVTFALLALKGVGTGSGKLSQVMRVLFPGTDLELRAEGRGDRLLLTWNRKNPAVATAASAVLAINDGPQHFEKRLDPIQIAEGSVLYKPVSGDVTFRLQVTGSDQTTAAGSLRVLDATAPASPEATTNPPLDVTNPTMVPPPLGTEEATAPPVSAPLSAQPSNRSSNPPVAFNRTSSPAKDPASNDATSKPAVETPRAVPTQQQPLTQTAAQQPAPTIPAPVTSNPRPATQRPTNNNPAPLTSNTSINGWDANLPENKPAAPQPHQELTIPPDGKTVDFIGPKVLLQVMPNTRGLPAGSITEVTRVEVQVVVDTNGHVRLARLANNNVKSQLGTAAIAAAKQWTFQPATLRGQHVESDHSIVFEFRPEGQ